MRFRKPTEEMLAMERVIEQNYEREHGHPMPEFRPRAKRAEGYVYFITSEQGGPIKVGWAKDPLLRMAELQIAHAYPLRLIGAIEGSVQREREIHVQFAEYRMSGEWFEGSPEVLAAIDGLLDG